ncbi:MAG TPA: tetratricopeptide repeat protein [Pirellulales bacterium]|jgi:tetratricopeptide (TPR) repeat protein|nr:tetratricopeptide repeat protein [Pirellulales bacterium]
MAAEENGNGPIPPAKRRRLQQLFEHGSKAFEQSNYEYASNLLGQCVVGDPSNKIYVGQYLNTLTRSYDNNPKNVSKLSSIKAAGSKTGLMNSSRQKDWPSVIKTGIDILKGNPWDVSTLTSMARACEELGYDDPQLLYLKLALNYNDKDIAVNRQCAKALARVGRFDDAIACWRRVELLKPNDEEAGREIGNLTVEKTIHHGGYEDAETTKDVKRAHQEADDAEKQRLTPEQRLEKQIVKSPADISLYVELADMHIRAERFAEAEEVLTRALAATGGGDLTLRERLEDVQVRHYRNLVQTAERRFDQEKTAEAAELVKKMRGELNRIELEVYRNRSDRNPTNLSLKYELGVRLKRAGQFQEAVQCLQTARADGKRKAQVHLELGECFQALKNYLLAMRNFEAALESLNDRDQDMTKLTLYRAGKLALYLAVNDVGSEAGKSWLELSEKHFTNLASLDYVYKDVPAMLEKIAKMRAKPGQTEQNP